MGIQIFIYFKVRKFRDQKVSQFRVCREIITFRWNKLSWLWNFVHLAGINLGGSKILKSPLRIHFRVKRLKNANPRKFLTLKYLVDNFWRGENLAQLTQNA